MSVRTTVESLFQAVAKEQKRPLAPLKDDLLLLNSGLDSLSLALIVARLEDSFGFDPFATIERFPVTFGDFVKLYVTSPQPEREENSVAQGTHAIAS
jgi:acyl carrier protein